MFLYRLWLKVHKPFLFLIFGCSSLLLLTKVSVVVSTVEASTDASSFSMNDIESRVIGEMTVDEDGQYEDLEEDHTIRELPFCGTNKQQKKNRDFDHSALNESVDSSEDSDEIVVTNPKKSKYGKRIVVATLDGKVSMLDQAGKLIWSICTGHLFSSTISSLQLSDRGKLIKLIPSLTGGLYKFDGESLQAMPLNAELLLKKSFKLAQDVVITGGKELKTFGIDSDSGDVKYECGINGCKSPTTAEFTSAEDSSGVVLVIKKHLQTVRAIDSSKGIERWNFSVGTHELALAGITEGCYEPAEDETVDHSYNNFKMVIPEGIVIGTNEENKTVWNHKFESPISQAWLLEDSRLQVMDPIKASSALMEDPPSLYVGIHKSQLYVQESHVTVKKLMNAMELEDANRSDFTMEPLQIGWRPSSSSLVTSSTNGEEKNENTALARFHSGGFYVYERDEIRNQPAIEAPNPSSGICLGDDPEEDIEEVNANREGEDMNEVILGLATLWFWWKEILGISLLTAVVLNIILLRPVVYLTRRRTIAEVVRQVNLFLRRTREQQLALPAPPEIPDSGISDTLDLSPTRVRTVSSSSAFSNHSEEQAASFVSQYLKEFEPVQSLGRGAFGTVFEAKKKIDDRTYAVKRIPLPNREKSRDRVMREVKALARLDHKNIVRYFNAWIESPPQGWLEKNDPLWNSIILNSPSPTYDHSSASAFTTQRSSMRKDHSEIYVHDQTPDGDDSFIVFENESIRRDESGITFAAHTKVENITEEPDESSSSSSWSDDSERKKLLPNEENPATNSKFFRRPTTLDIPSSTDTTAEDKRSWELSLKSDNQNDISNPLSIMYLYIQQELCQKRTLQDWLRLEKTRSLKQVMGMFAQLVDAVEYIHANKLIHRDLKPGNIFLAGGSESGDTNEMVVKIGDFGLATTLVGGEFGLSDIRGGDDALVPANAKLTGQVGTQLYMAPEQSRTKVYDHKVDIFSLGLIFFELLVPCSTDMEKHTELNKLRQMKFPKNFPNKFPEQYELIQDMISHDPNSRPDACEVREYLSKHLLGSSTRSRSFPERLLDTTNNQKTRKSNVRIRDKESRLIYKTHSAM